MMTSIESLRRRISTTSSGLRASARTPSWHSLLVEYSHYILRVGGRDAASCHTTVPCFLPVSRSTILDADRDGEWRREPQPASSHRLAVERRPRRQTSAGPGAGVETQRQTDIRETGCTHLGC